LTRSRGPTTAVIAGTGVADLFDLGPRQTVKTRFGIASVSKSKGGDFYLLQRHGPGHTIPPHMINYRANALALLKMGVTHIIATSAVGSMNPEFEVGELGLAEQVLDCTRRREATLFAREVVHTDMTQPYDPDLSSAVARAASTVGVPLKSGLVYVCVDGPRFETAAEIRMFRNLGGDVVGMTGVPEVVMAREAGMKYSSVVIATNWAAGIQEKVSHDEVVDVMRRSGQKVTRILGRTVNDLLKTPVGSEPR
jgi:5'-methylthioadenosine phosphorylase